MKIARRELVDVSVTPWYHCITRSAESWQFRLEKLKIGRSIGRFFAASWEKLRDLATRLNVRHLVNLVGCAGP